MLLVGVAAQAELSELQSRPRLGLLDLIREPWMRYPLLISIGLQLSQQLSGINGVRYFTVNIFVLCELCPEGTSVISFDCGF